MRPSTARNSASASRPSTIRPWGRSAGCCPRVFTSMKITSSSATVATTRCATRAVVTAGESSASSSCGVIAARCA